MHSRQRTDGYAGQGIIALPRIGQRMNEGCCIQRIRGEQGRFREVYACGFGYAEHRGVEGKVVDEVDRQ